MSKPKPKRPSRSFARLRQAARRRFDFDATEEPRETIMFLPLQDHEFKGLEKLARHKGSSLAVEIHRAIDMHLQGGGQPLQRVNELLVRFHASLERNSRLLKEELRKVRKMRVHLAHQQSRSPRSRR